MKGGLFHIDIWKVKPFTIEVDSTVWKEPYTGKNSNPSHFCAFCAIEILKN
jgi:hypothetical protein